MYQGKHVSRRRRTGRKIGVLSASLLLILTLMVSGTLAYLFTKTEPVENTFTPAHVSCEVTENFDGKTKSNVNVENTSDIPAYIRVKLVTYRVNEQGQHIGGTASVPKFTPGTNWVEHDGYYYYTLPVNPDEKPSEDLIGSISLTGSYNDADGGKQVIEVMAEAIQSSPATAVQQAWGVAISSGSVTAYNG